MRKLTSLVFLVILLTLCLLTFASCGGGLDTPLNLDIDVPTQSLIWDEVKGTRSYTVKVSDGLPEAVVYTNSYSLEYLAPGEYTLYVKANGDGQATNDSDWAKIPYKRYEESGLEYALINGGKEYQLIGAGDAEGEVKMEAVYREKPVTSIAPKALNSNTKITGFTVGENVKTIGDKAFIKCPQLKYVIVPEGVESVGEYAFQSCKLLERVELPNTVKEIKPHTFAWCSALTELKIGNQITAVGEYAFSNCSTLVKVNFDGNENKDFKVNFPGTLKAVAQYAFAECHSLADINLGEVRDIAIGAFSGCKALTTVKLGDSLKKLGDSAFYKCESLLAISIPDSAEIIEKYAFADCKKLAEVNLGAGLKSVGVSVFYGTAVEEAAKASGTLVIDGWLIDVFEAKSPVFTVPQGVCGIASYAASENDVIKSLNLGGVKYVCEAAFNKCSNLEAALFDDSLVSIDTAAFYECPYLKTVDLGDSVEAIGDYAFFGCEKLDVKDGEKGISIPDSVKRIGKQVFRNTLAYTNVSKTEAGGGVVYIDKWAVDYIVPKDIYADAVIKDGTFGIANYTFANQSIMRVTIEDSVEYIGRGAFYKAFCISVALPSGLKHIDDYAFYNCQSTNFGGYEYDLVIPDGTLTIGRSAFYSCFSILSLSVPQSVVSIGDYAFYDCQNIGNTVEVEKDTGEVNDDGEPIFEVVEATGFIELSEGLEVIGNRAFQGCLSIIELVIPDSVNSLGYLAFYDCPELKEIHFGKGITEIKDHMFHNNTSIEKVVISGALEKIGDGAFEGCTSLEVIDMKSVKNIGNRAFFGCSSLKSVTLPENLQSIGDSAFIGCRGLSAIIIPESVVSIGNHAFNGLNNLTLYLEADSVPKGFSKLFNSSFRPIVLGCELSEDGKFVTSFTKGEVLNSLAINGISDPIHEGYEFVGWSTEAGSDKGDYTSETVSDAKDGVKLYAVWNKISGGNN